MSSGFFHGTSTCYLAAALDESGTGHVTTIDPEEVRAMRPNIDTLLERTALARYVSPIFTHTSYTWDLMRMIEAQTTDGQCEPSFDFCFIDGAHTWETDGAAFFMADKLLQPGGWLLLDDLTWSFATSPTLKSTERVLSMPEDERNSRQIGSVFDLLVRQHPSYAFCEARDGWGWAQKVGSGANGSRFTGAVLDAYYHERSILEDARLLVQKVWERKIKNQTRA